MEAEVAADNEMQPFNILVLNRGQPPRKCLAGSAPAPLVERDQLPSLIMVAQQRFGFEAKNTLGIVVSATGHRPQHTILGRPSPMHPFTVGFDLLFVRARRRSDRKSVV